MQIRELTLKNFRVFAEPRTFVFGEQFTVIAGVNGRGKTAILDGLALLFSRLLPLVTPAREGYQTMSPYSVHQGASVAELSTKIRWPRNTIEYKLTYDKSRGRTTTTKLFEQVRDSLKGAYGDGSPVVAYYTTERAHYRQPRRLPKEVAVGRAAAYIGALSSQTVNFRDFMARYRAANVLANEEQRENPGFLGGRFVNAVSHAISSLLEGFLNLRLEYKPLQLIIDKRGMQLNLAQLSDGERSFVAIVCDLVRRLALANPSGDALSGVGVVLIDEIELHLHPQWQREVVDKLKTTFPRIQFVTTTHSPFIIQSLRPGELINLDPDEFGEYADRSIEDIAETVMGVEVPQKSERYQKMMEAAEEYFRLLREMPAQPPDAVETARQRLNELAEPFSDDPAFQALLKVERETRSGPGSNETG